MQRYTVPKLVPNLQGKTNYVVHYHNLSSAIFSIGRGVDQYPPSVSVSTEIFAQVLDHFQRKHAADEFEKDFTNIVNLN